MVDWSATKGLIQGRYNTVVVPLLPARRDRNGYLFVLVCCVTEPANKDGFRDREPTLMGCETSFRPPSPPRGANACTLLCTLRCLFLSLVCPGGGGGGLGRLSATIGSDKTASVCFPQRTDAYLQSELEPARGKFLSRLEEVCCVYITQHMYVFPVTWYAVRCK